VRAWTLRSHVGSPWLPCIGTGEDHAAHCVSHAPAGASQTEPAHTPAD
jgi:hypothetical protein